MFSGRKDGQMTTITFEDMTQGKEENDGKRVDNSIHSRAFGYDIRDGGL